MRSDYWAALRAVVEAYRFVYVVRHVEWQISDVLNGIAGIRMAMGPGPIMAQIGGPSDHPLEDLRDGWGFPLRDENGVPSFKSEGIEPDLFSEALRALCGVGATIDDAANYLGEQLWNLKKLKGRGWRQRRRSVEGSKRVWRYGVCVDGPCLELIKELLGEDLDCADQFMLSMIDGTSERSAKFLLPYLESMTQGYDLECLRSVYVRLVAEGAGDEEFRNLLEGEFVEMAVLIKTKDVPTDACWRNLAQAALRITFNEPPDPVYWPEGWTTERPGARSPVRASRWPPDQPPMLTAGLNV